MLVRHVCALTGLAFAMLAPAPARAWEVGTQLNHKGCHEPITAAALLAVRARLATAPVIVPTDDEAALIADVQFVPPSELVHDLAGMSLLLGVRDNDLKGQNPLSSLDLVHVHGDPLTQSEHCIRDAQDDDEAGVRTALIACRDFIRLRATEALAGLDASGTVDASVRAPLEVYVSIAGHVEPPLPVFYVKMGQALHALEDGFTHTYRTADGMRVTTMLNWIEMVGGTLEEGRDGPPHRMQLDDCSVDDPIVVRNLALSIQAATELLHAALDPTLSEAQKVAAFEELTTRYLTFEAGCDVTNGWCDAPEAVVTAPGVLSCRIGAGDDLGGVVMIVVVALILMVMTRKRQAPRWTAGAILLIGAVVIARAPARAHADSPAPGDAAPATTPATAANAEDPAVVARVTEPGDAQDAREGKEPGRDEKTPSVAEVAEVRDDKRLGNRFGFATAAGVSFSRGAAVAMIGGRFRINEKWIVGLNVAWNPWITTAPINVRAGALEVYATGIRRWPMRYDRVNLRTSLHIGTATLLFDVYGTPKHSTGLFLAGSVLGLDYDLGNSLRLVIDPAEMALAIPSLGGVPLWYEQFRFMIGLQYGS
jgi:hypothetical protein